MIVASPHEQSALDEFALLRDQVPERLRLVVDHLADEHVTLLRLCNGDSRERSRRRRDRGEGVRALAKRGEHVWLVTAEEETPPVHAQVLDLSIGRLYPRTRTTGSSRTRAGRRCRLEGRTWTSSGCLSASR